MNNPGFAKSAVIYNYDQAMGYEVIAVVEGITDVWKVGVWGMALFGKTMSQRQLALLADAAERRQKWMVLIGDASTKRDAAAASWMENFFRLRERSRRPKRIWLHVCEEGDPGDRTPDELHDIVNKAFRSGTRRPQ